METNPERNFSNGKYLSSLEKSQWAALIAGGTLAAFGLSRRSAPGVALAAAGAALAYAGLRSNDGLADEYVESSVVVNTTPGEAYALWRDFENLPRFMRHLESVTSMGSGRTRWIMIGPAGTPIKWDAEIVSERENEFIHWCSLPGSDIDMEGTVDFGIATGNRGTLVTAGILYSPPAGKIGSSIARMLGKDPAFLMRNDLRRFKALIETGEIPTTEGQPHGPRSLVTGAARLVDPDSPVRRGSRMSEILNAKRSIA